MPTSESVRRLEEEGKGYDNVSAARETRPYGNCATRFGSCDVPGDLACVVARRACRRPGCNGTVELVTT